MSEVTPELEGCAVSYPDGGLCDRTSLPDAPFPICVKHAAKVMSFLRNSLLEDGILTEQDRRAAAAVAANRAAAVRPVTEVVYYLRVGDLIKIGTSAQFATRLRSYPPSTVVLGIELGGRDLEQERLRQFDRFRAQGHEWFHPNDRLIAHIRALPPVVDWTVSTETAVAAIEELRTADLYGGLMSAGEAARYAGVDGETIRRWRKMNYLPVVARCDRGRPLFRRVDVARADKARRATGVSVPQRLTHKRGAA